MMAMQEKDSGHVMEETTDCLMLCLRLHVLLP